MTRADFYLGRGLYAVWLGSVAADGKPGAVFGGFRSVLFAVPGPTAEEWTAWVARYLDGRNWPTRPEDGWPWPWPGSGMTDYAYAWDDEVIYGSSFGRPWFRVDPWADRFGEPDPEGPDGLHTSRVALFPDMTALRNVTHGPRSGLIAF